MPFEWWTIIVLLVIYIHLHKVVQRGEKKTKSIYEERPKITTPKPRVFLDRTVSNWEKSRYNEKRTSTQTQMNDTNISQLFLNR